MNTKETTLKIRITETDADPIDTEFIKMIMGELLGFSPSIINCTVESEEVNTPTATRLQELSNALRRLRDNQTEIPCREDGCICQQFDLILDELESLQEKFDS